MLAERIYLALIGLTSGFSVAAGSFALVVALGIVPRIIGKSSTAPGIIRYENVIMAGGVLGNIVSVYDSLRIPLGRPGLVLYGLGSGVYVGCLVMALAEIVDVFPLMFRRLNLKTGLQSVIICMAAGKVIGGLWYFYSRLSV